MGDYAVGCMQILTLFCVRDLSTSPLDCGFWESAHVLKPVGSETLGVLRDSCTELIQVKQVSLLQDFSVMCAESL